MSLKDKLTEDMKKAQKAKDKLALSVLRMVRASIKNKEIEIGNELGDKEVIEVIASAIKQRKESKEQFLKAERLDLSRKEGKEMDILLCYMPEQACEDEIKKKASEIIIESNASSLKDIGKIMKVMMLEFKGKADGGVINRIVKEILKSGS